MYGGKIRNVVFWWITILIGVFNSADRAQHAKFNMGWHCQKGSSCFETERDRATVLTSAKMEGLLRLRLAGGTGADKSVDQHESDTIEILRDNMESIQFSEESEPANCSDHANLSSPTNVKASCEPLGSQSDDCDPERNQIARSSAHRIIEVTEPDFEDELDDPSKCPAVVYFLTRCPHGRVDKGIYFGSCRWHLVTLLENAWEGQVPHRPSCSAPSFRQ